MKYFLLFISFCLLFSATKISQIPLHQSLKQDDGPGFDGPDHDSCKSGKTCEFLNQIWARDTESVYLDTWDFHGVVAGLDPKTFILCDPKGESPYAKDANSVFYFEHLLPDAHLETFQQVNDRHGKDARHVYLGTKVIAEADPLSFRSFPENVWYAKDQKHVFYTGQIVTEAKPDAFEVLKQPGNCGKGCWFDAQDKYHKFANGKMVLTGGRH